MALVVIALVAAAALDTLIATHRLELAARESSSLRRALGHALVASRDAESDWPADGRRTLRGGVWIEALPVKTTPGADQSPPCVRWTLSSQARPSLRSVVYTQPDSLQP